MDIRGIVRTAGDVANLDQLVTHLPRASRIDAARTLLAEPAVRSSPIVRGPLATLRDALDGATLTNPTPARVLDDVRSWIGQEIDRIDGRIPSGGLDGHPDYATVGAISSGLSLLDRLGALPTPRT